jgi:hypothetical protein
MEESYDPHELERLRRSVVMLQPRQLALKREEAMRLITQAQRLQQRMARVVTELRAIVEWTREGPE